MEPGAPLLFDLPSLEKGDSLQVYASRLNGNLDPFVGIVKDNIDLNNLTSQLEAGYELAIQDGQDPLEVIANLANQRFVVWDDDGGDGYGATLQFSAPESGNYKLFVTESPLTNSFGTVLLALSINQGEPLEDILAAATRDNLEIEDLSYGNTILSQVEAFGSPSGRVEERFETLSRDKVSTFFMLDRLEQGQTLYAYVESTDGSFSPTLSLEDYGGKFLRTANYLGESTSGQLSYAIDEDTISNLRLTVTAENLPESTSTQEFRLLVGIDEPAVLEGTAASRGKSPILEPTPVKIGLKVQQITDIDQLAENFGIVGSLQLQWNDPYFAYSPDSCQCRLKEFTFDNFTQQLNEANRFWPNFTIYNQQGRRFSQNQVFIVLPDGTINYFERFSVTLQAPDFYFRSFPFDIQTFFVRIVSLYPEEIIQFVTLEDFSALGDQLGEEEWVPTSFSTSISSRLLSTTDLVSSEFSIKIIAQRHLNFYILRIFIPIGIIIFVSWLPGFLGDFSKRIDIANGTLLLFIAFNFTISNDLPRLGYITFVDILLLSTFILTSLILIYNVTLKRLESEGKGILVQKIDRITLWLIPLVYFLSYAIIAAVFL